MYLHVKQSELQVSAGLACNSQLQAIRLVESQFRLDPTAPIGPGHEVHLETEIKHGVVSVGVEQRQMSAQLRFEVVARLGGSHLTVVSLRSRWRLTYAIHPELPVKELSAAATKAFCRSSATMNAWPFWREYALTTLSRAGLPFFSLPLLTLRTTENESAVAAMGQKLLSKPPAPRRRKVSA